METKTMFINLTSAGASLADIDNFKAFKVTTALPREALAGAMAAAGQVDGAHAWIDPGWLTANGRPDDPVWRAGLAKMLDYAKSAGWVNAQGAIRAHIEFL